MYSNSVTKWNLAIWSWESYTGKMVMKWPFVGDTGSICTFIIKSSWEIEILVDAVVLLERWSGKAILPEDRALR